DNKRYAEEALNQVLIHLRLLQDTQTQVLFHGWNCDTGSHMSAARWTRANAWVTLGVPMILVEIAPHIEVPDEVIERYGRLIKGLAGYQQADGLWSTVMDEPDYYREISGSAGIGAGISKALETGMIEPDEQWNAVVERVLQAVIPYISEEGEVGGVSGGTPVLASIAAYNEVPIYPALYGQGLVLLLLVQAIRGKG
ncbi:glycoside hydrolase family 88 protein, partial [Paenibacillus sepulcri]|nr:glycoside hydrolase family 88 protein [Paenibacillus sepulcri]